MPSPKPCGVASVRYRDRVVENLRMGQEAGRDDRPAGPQVLIDLQGSVGSAAARRNEYIGGIKECRDLFSRTLTGEDDCGLDTRTPRFGACQIDLIRAATGKHEKRVGAIGEDMPSRVEQ